MVYIYYNQQYDMGTMGMVDFMREYPEYMEIDYEKDWEWWICSWQ